MPTFKVNGKPVEFQPGDMALTALLRAGIYVPHFCYHPGLSPEGNCRICLVKSNQSRKLEVSCMTRCNEKLEIETEVAEVQAARRDVMEFLLINHPLDCPICDKAGECDLQDFTFKYRGGLSRFVDEKSIRHTKDLGPDIAIWGNRCIACSRCVRFCEEIPGTAELALVNRGDRSVIDVFPGVPIENPMSLNVVDICPVGALIDKNFLFEQRVWLGERKPTVCTSCSRGCNMEAMTHQNGIKRFSPRHNPDVNGYWACDEGRFNVAHVASPRRLVEGKGTVRDLASRLRDFAILISTSNTVEEMWLAKQFGVPVSTMTRSRGPKWTSKSGWTIESDGTSNAAFADLLFDPAELGDVKQLIWINAIPARAWDDAFEAKVKELELFAVFDILQRPIQRHAQFVFPSAAFAEKEGTVVNVDGRIQRLRKVVEPPPGARPELEVLQELLKAMEKRPRVLSAEGVFREAAKEVQALAGLDYRKIGDLGAPLHLVTA